MAKEIISVLDTEARKIAHQINKDEEPIIFEFFKTLNFKTVKLLGRGGYGRVYMVHSSMGNNDELPCPYYAVKVVKNKPTLVQREKDILERAKIDNQQFIINMVSYFKNPYYSYFVLDLMYCDLNRVIRRYELTEDDVRFYIEEIIIALDYLHSNRIIYKDLKPGNVLIDFDGHIKLCDFGNSDDKVASKNRSGTKRLMAPEVLLQKNHGREVDWWSMGVMMYLMIFGKYPFVESDNQPIINLIMQDNLDLTGSNGSSESINLIKGLLRPNPKKRIGLKGSALIKRHVFFRKTNWDTVLNRCTVPPVIPFRKENFKKKKRDPITVSS